MDAEIRVARSGKAAGCLVARRRKWAAVSGASGCHYRVAFKKSKLATTAWSGERTATKLGIKRKSKKLYLEVRTVNGGGPGVGVKSGINTWHQEEVAQPVSNL